MTKDWFQKLRRDGAVAAAELDGLADINITRDDGGNLLHAAIAYSNPVAAIELIRRGINVNAADASGKMPLHYACDYQNTFVAESILEHGGLVDVVDEHGNTPLWSAVFSAKGKYDVVQLLIAHGARKLAEKKNKHGRSPLDFAKQVGDTQLVEMLSGK